MQGTHVKMVADTGLGCWIVRHRSGEPLDARRLCYRIYLLPQCHHDLVAEHTSRLGSIHLTAIQGLSHGRGFGDDLCTDALVEWALCGYPGLIYELPGLSRRRPLQSRTTPPYCMALAAQFMSLGRLTWVMGEMANNIPSHRRRP